VLTMHLSPVWVYFGNLVCKLQYLAH